MAFNHVPDPEYERNGKTHCLICRYPVMLLDVNSNEWIHVADLKEEESLHYHHQTVDEKRDELIQSAQSVDRFIAFIQKLIARFRRA